MNMNIVDIVRNNRGSTLIWVLILMLVLGILITAGLAIAQAYSKRSIDQHYEKQSYYTAYSATKAMAEWLQGTTITTTSGGAVGTEPEESSAQQTFINSLRTAGTLTKNVNIDSGDMGTCITTFTMNNDGDILISSKAEYQGESSTVSVTMKNTTKSETTSGEPGEPGGWVAYPIFNVPEKIDSTLSRDFNNSINGNISISGTVNAKGNSDINGYVLIPKDTTFNIHSSGHNLTKGGDSSIALNVIGTFNVQNSNAVINGDILINGGKAEINNNTVITGNIYVVNNGSIQINNTGTVTGHIFVYPGGTLILNNTRINGGIVVYKGTIRSTINVNGAVNFPAATYNPEKSGIFFADSSDPDDPMPNLASFNFSRMTYPGHVHIKDLDYTKTGTLVNYAGPAYCTSSKDAICKHNLPQIPSSVITQGTPGGGTPGTTTTISAWSIGSYTGS